MRFGAGRASINSDIGLIESVGWVAGAARDSAADEAEAGGRRHQRHLQDHHHWDHHHKVRNILNVFF